MLEYTFNIDNHKYKVKHFETCLVLCVCVLETKKEAFPRNGLNSRGILCCLRIINEFEIYIIVDNNLARILLYSREQNFSCIIYLLCCTYCYNNIHKREFFHIIIIIILLYFLCILRILMYFHI